MFKYIYCQKLTLNQIPFVWLAFSFTKVIFSEDIFAFTQVRLLNTIFNPVIVKERIKSYLFRSSYFLGSFSLDFVNVTLLSNVLFHYYFLNVIFYK